MVTLEIEAKIEDPIEADPIEKQIEDQIKERMAEDVKMEEIVINDPEEIDLKVKADLDGMTGKISIKSLIN